MQCLIVDRKEPSAIDFFGEPGIDFCELYKVMKTDSLFVSLQHVKVHIIAWVHVFKGGPRYYRCWSVLDLAMQEQYFQTSTFTVPWN